MAQRILILASLGSAPHVRRQEASESDVVLLNGWLERPDWTAQFARRDAARSKQRIPGRHACDAAPGHSSCCYGTNLTERLENMRSWSRAALPKHQDQPVLYLYAGVDVHHAAGLFPDAPAYVIAAFHPPFRASRNSSDLLSETRACLQQPRCADSMALAALSWYDHVRCLSFQMSMSWWMRRRHFQRHGTFPALLLSMRLLGYDIESVECFAGYEDAAHAEKARGDHFSAAPDATVASGVQGILLRVRTRGGQRKTVAYIACALGEATIAPFLREARSACMAAAARPHHPSRIDHSTCASQVLRVAAGAYTLLFKGILYEFPGNKTHHEHVVRQ